MSFYWNWPKEDLCTFNNKKDEDGRYFKRIQNILYNPYHTLYLVVDYHLHFLPLFISNIYIYIY
jgi:hypothetical protein